MDWRGRTREWQSCNFRRDAQPLITMDWRGEVVHPFPFFRRDAQPLPWIGVVERANARYSCNFYASFATLTMDWRGRTCEREVKLHLFPSFRRVAQPLPWTGVVERANAKVRLQLFGVPRSPYHGFWRGPATEREVKLQLFGAPSNPLRGLVWSSD